MVEREIRQDYREKKREEARMLLLSTMRKMLGNGKIANFVAQFLADLRA